MEEDNNDPLMKLENYLGRRLDTYIYYNDKLLQINGPGVIYKDLPFDKKIDMNVLLKNLVDVIRSDSHPDAIVRVLSKHIKR